MEYLIQYRILENSVHSNDEFEIDFEGINAKLYLKDKSILTVGKKAHFIVIANDTKEAHEKIWNNLTHFNHRLMFLTCKRVIFIHHPELIMEAQGGSDERDILFWELRSQHNNIVEPWRINQHKAFFNTRLDKRDYMAIGFYNEALQSELPIEKYRSLYLALEKLAGGKESKQEVFLKSANSDPVFRGRTIPTAKEFWNLRNDCSHANRKKKKIDRNILFENTGILASLIRIHLTKKYNITYDGAGVGNNLLYPDGPFNAKFYTEHPKEKFAVEDIPSLEEYLNRSSNTRWIFD